MGYPGKELRCLVTTCWNRGATWWLLLATGRVLLNRVCSPGFTVTLLVGPSPQRSSASPSPLELAEGVPVLVCVVRSTAESRRVCGTDSG
jgi:hypothetical protein